MRCWVEHLLVEFTTLAREYKCKLFIALAYSYFYERPSPHVLSVAPFRLSRYYEEKYIQPEMKVYDIEPQQILQSSTENFYLGGRPADDNEGMR